MMHKAMLALLTGAGALLPFIAGATGNDELWEVTSQMNMPGMPAGMGAMTQQLCQDKDPSKHAAQGQNMENCKVTDRKQSGNRITMTLTCPDGRAVIENTYNAARTEYTGSVRMTSAGGDMTMAMSGRKIGSCDAQQARQQRDAQQAKIQADVDRGKQQVKQIHDQQIAQCAEAVRTMDMYKLGVYAQRTTQRQATSDPSMKEVNAACSARQAEFCKRYQTEEGFLLAKGDARAAEMCGVSAEQVKGSLCPGAVQNESLAFAGRYCIAEAKPLAEKHCAGRDFTALRATRGQGDKYSDFCLAYFSNASLDTAAAPRRQEEPKSNPADAVQQGVTQGINKLRGLFGR